MPKKVKNGFKGRAGGRTRISSKHQITIPVGAFRAARLDAGDTVQVEADGPGRVVVTRLDALLDRYEGCLPAGTLEQGYIDRLRDEWG